MKSLRDYNPDNINIEVREVMLQELTSRTSVTSNEVLCSWNDGIKSRLIESILIRIPVQGFWIDATGVKEWIIVDGFKRLSTIKQFVEDKTLKLCELEYLEELKGKTFIDLERRYQRRIEETQVTVYLIKPGTPAEVKQSIIDRIKT
jgi:hypothetical protein